MPSHGSHTSHRGEGQGQPRLQEFPVTELAQALGCPRATAQEVTQALVALSKVAVSRFGAPLTAHRAIGSLIAAPDRSELLYKLPEIPGDPRWHRLAAAIIPPLSDGFPIAELKAASRSDLEALKGEVTSLAADLKELRLGPISERTAAALKGSLSSVKLRAIDAPDLQERNLNAFRQLKLHLEVAPEWGVVTPMEHLFLTWCAAPERSETPTAPAQSKAPPLHRTDRASPPSQELLEKMGLVWIWSDKRSAWEPAPKNSRYLKSTLFDHSSYYFEARLAPDAPPLNATTRRLFEALFDAAREFERTRGGDESAALRKLHAAQERSLAIVGKG